jgi:hypothetical protein
MRSYFIQKEVIRAQDELIKQYKEALSHSDYMQEAKDEYIKFLEGKVEELLALSKEQLEILQKPIILQ